MTLSHADLTAQAFAVIRPRPIGKHVTGDVGAAFLAADGKVYLGVCVDLPCGIGFCAEHGAIAAMATAGQSRILQVVAVHADGHVVPPCGRCREALRQFDPANMEAEVLLGGGKSKKLKELLPEPW